MRWASSAPGSRARCRRCRPASGPTPCGRRRSRRRAAPASPARPARWHGSAPSGSRPRQIRTKALCSSSSATVVGSVWPGRMTVSGGSASSTSMIEPAQVGVGRVARRAHAADRALEQRVAGEDVALDEEAQHPRGVARRVQRRDRSPATSSGSPGVMGRTSPSTSAASSGWARTVMPGQRSRSAPSSATWSWWWWVSRTWVGVSPWRSASATRGATGPPASMKTASAPGVADEVGVRQELGHEGSLDQHGRVGSQSMPALIHTCYRIGDIDRSVAFYEALGFEEVGRMPIRDEAINVFMGLPGDGAAARADLQPRRRRLRARHGLQPHRDHGRGPRRDARPPGRAGHRAREAALHRPRGRLAALLRARPGRLPDRADRGLSARRRASRRRGWRGRPRGVGSAW